MERYVEISNPGHSTKNEIFRYSVDLVIFTEESIMENFIFFELENRSNAFSASICLGKIQDIIDKLKKNVKRI